MATTAPPPQPPLADPQPGTIPALVPWRPLSIGEILGGAFRAVQRHPGVIIGLAALLAFLTTVAHGIIDQVASDVADSIPSDGDDLASNLRAAREATGKNAPLTAIDAMLDPFAQFVLAGMLIVVVMRSAFGWSTRLDQAWQVLRPRIGQLISASFLFGLCTAGVVTLLQTLLIDSITADANTGSPSAGGTSPGRIAITVAGVVVLIALQTWLAAATPVIVTEKEDTLDSIVRSRRLLKNSWWRTFWLLMLSYLLTMLVGQGLQLVPVVGEYLGAVVDAAFVATITTLIYFDLVVRRSGGVPADLLRLVDVPSASPAATTASAAGDPPIADSQAGPQQVPQAPVSAARQDSPPKKGSTDWGGVLLFVFFVVATIFAVNQCQNGQQRVRDAQAKATEQKRQAEQKRVQELENQRRAQEAQRAFNQYLHDADVACGAPSLRLPGGNVPNNWPGAENYLATLTENLSGQLIAWQRVKAPTAQADQARRIIEEVKQVQMALYDLRQAAHDRNPSSWNRAANAYQLTDPQAVEQHAEAFGFRVCGRSLYRSN